MNGYEINQSLFQIVSIMKISEKIQHKYRFAFAISIKLLLASAGTCIPDQKVNQSKLPFELKFNFNFVYDYQLKSVIKICYYFFMLSIIKSNIDVNVGALLL